MAKLWQFWQDHTKAAFSEKVQRGDRRKFFKNRPKRCSRLKGLKVHWRKLHYLFISMHLKCKDWRRFSHRTPLQKCKNGRVMAIFARSPKTRIFLKKWKFFKNRPKSSPRFKRPTALWRKRHFPVNCIRL